MSPTDTIMDVLRDGGKVILHDGRSFYGNTVDGYIKVALDDDMIGLGEDIYIGLRPLTEQGLLNAYADCAPVLDDLQR